MTPRPLFPKARPTKAAKGQLPRKPRDWRRHTHVCVQAGQFDWDGEPLCFECGMRRDHRVHDLNQDVAAAAAEIDARKLGEG